MKGYLIILILLAYIIWVHTEHEEYAIAQFVMLLTLLGSIVYFVRIFGERFK